MYVVVSLVLMQDSLELFTRLQHAYTSVKVVVDATAVVVVVVVPGP